jgi:hypothetical protein
MFGLGPIYGMLLQPHLVSRSARPRLRRSVIATNIALAALVGALCWLVGWREYLLVQMPTALLAGAAGVWLFYVSTSSRTESGRLAIALDAASQRRRALGPSCQLASSSTNSQCGVSPQADGASAASTSSVAPLGRTRTRRDWISTRSASGGVRATKPAITSMASRPWSWSAASQ